MPRFSSVKPGNGTENDNGCYVRNAGCDVSLLCT